MIVAAAVIPGAPELLSDNARTDESESWRRAATEGLVQALAEARTGDGRAEPSELLVVSSVSTGAITTPPAYGPPVGLAVAREIIDLAAAARALDLTAVPVEEVAIAEDATGEEAATLGLVAGSFPVRPGSDEEARTVLLVVADGSERRGEEDADRRAAAFDETWRQALADGDHVALTGLAEDEAAEVQATCRAPLQVLATAADDRHITARVLASGEPFGTGHAVVVWRCD